MAREAMEEARAGASGWKAVLPVLGYGVVCGILFAVLHWTEYRFLVIEHSVEIYGGLVAVLFAAVGIWLGLKLTRTRVETIVVEIPVEIPVEVPGPPVVSSGPFAVDTERQRELAITPRELEMLGFLAAGLSNREIAARTFVSENTVKTHVSRLFDKLGAKRRTQAVQLGKGLRLIP
ncbi:MAG: helix-turn-helix transcriptional regulator [Thermoanaerobaculia bacterium]